MNSTLHEIKRVLRSGAITQYMLLEEKKLTNSKAKQGKPVFTIISPVKMGNFDYESFHLSHSLFPDRIYNKRLKNTYYLKKCRTPKLDRRPRMEARQHLNTFKEFNDRSSSVQKNKLNNVFPKLKLIK